MSLWDFLNCWRELAGDGVFPSKDLILLLIDGPALKSAVNLRNKLGELSAIFIIDLKPLNDLVKKRVIEMLDHSQIEKDIKWFKNKQPSTENMVVYIWHQLKNYIPKPAKLFSIKLQETPTIYTEYFGPENEKNK